MAGFFGNMFDFNRDGNLDSFERAADFCAFNELMNAQQSADILDDDDDDDYELELAGLNPEELEFMDEDERREVLEEAGLDPDDFDF